MGYETCVLEKHVHLACHMCGTPPIKTLLLNKWFPPPPSPMSTRICRQRTQACWTGEVENTGMHKAQSPPSVRTGGAGRMCAVEGGQWIKQLRVKCPLSGEGGHHPTLALEQHQVVFRKPTRKSPRVSEVSP